MSESSSNRSVREFRNHLNSYQWTHQISVFYNSYNDRYRASKDKERVTRWFRRSFPETPFLYRLCLSKPLESEWVLDLPDDIENPILPYHTCFTNTPISIKRIEESLRKILKCDIRVKGMILQPWRKKRYIKTIQKEGLHDLLNYFPDLKHQRRTAFINKRNAIKKSDFIAVDHILD